MKYGFTAIICTLYVYLFYTNVESIRLMNLGMHLVFPMFVLVMSVLAFVGALVTRRAQRGKFRIYTIPAMLFISGAITLFVGYSAYVGVDAIEYLKSLV